MSVSYLSLSEYARLYHGTSQAAAESIVQGQFRISETAGDWLGRGAYFFDTKERARQWALRYHPKSPAIITAEVDMSTCMDLSDHKWFNLFSQYSELALAKRRLDGFAEIEQDDDFHGLDAYFIDAMIDELSQAGMKIDSVRGNFQYGMAAFPGSAITEHAHRQIAVRNPEKIKVIAIETVEGD